MSVIAYSIPVFFALIGVEVAVARWKKRSVYRFSDAISDLSCGVLNQVFGVLIGLATIAIYVHVQAHFAFLTIPMDAWWGWLACFVLVDFCYYWFHRISHEVGFMWAAHVVHHQSEEYNLSVALRQSSLQPGYSWVFYLPLAFIGFPPVMFYSMSAVNTLYQFWIHTRLIGRMGPLEWILNTPSHHRVHHGQNPQYIDRNHAGIFILWDRLFGTFEPEGEDVVYGITEPSRSWNPLWVNVHAWAGLVSRARRTRRLVDKVRVFVERPGWLPPDLTDDKASLGWPPPKYDPPIPSGVTSYVALQFVWVVLGTVGYLLVPTREALLQKLGFGLAIFLAVLAFGGLLEGRRWAYGLEWFRPAVTVIGLGMLFGMDLPLGVYLGAIVWIIGSLWAVRRMSKGGALVGASPSSDSAPAVE